jgi:glutamate-1-semialdehyde 2,1-aminomutase
LNFGKLRTLPWEGTNMLDTVGWCAIGAVGALWLGGRLRQRRTLSKAKSSSLLAQPSIAMLVSKAIPFYEYSEEHFFRSDGAPDEVVRRRRTGFQRLRGALVDGSEQSLRFTDSLEGAVSEIEFSSLYRVPFPYRSQVKKLLRLSSVVTESNGAKIKDLDGNWLYDLSGSNGVNLFGYDFYKNCMKQGLALVEATGLVLGPYHPVVADNVERLRAISGLDEVSFHMSGTEAVMQAVRLARFHTGKTQLVRFSGAYHGWWDGVQSRTVSHREARDMYTLKEMNPRTLEVLRTRKDIACVLVNPMQALHPNQNPPSDSMLINSGRRAKFERARYTEWLRELRRVCSERGIALIFDEVFVGFRLALGGAQEYFGVAADLVTYGKSLGGGFPIGVLCGKKELMRRFRADRPNLTCFARGTFSAHPAVMGAMNEFLRHVDAPAHKASYAALDELWNTRALELNRSLEQRGLPIRVANLGSIWTILYEVPSRYNWMLQFYLRAEGIALGAAGSGRLVMPHTLPDEEWQAITERLVRAATAMQSDGFWHAEPTLSNGSIAKGVFREVLRKTLFGVSPPAAVGLPEGALVRGSETQGGVNK